MHSHDGHWQSVYCLFTTPIAYFLEESDRRKKTDTEQKNEFCPGTDLHIDINADDIQEVSEKLSEKERLLWIMGGKC